MGKPLSVAYSGTSAKLCLRLLADPRMRYTPIPERLLLMTSSHWGQSCC